MTRKTKFTKKGESMLRGKITSLGDFIDDQPGSHVAPIKNFDKTVVRELDSSKNQFSEKPENLVTVPDRRFELKIPDNLAKQINDHAFDRRMSKAAVVIEALQRYFQV